MIFRYQGTQKIVVVIGVVFMLMALPMLPFFGLPALGDIVISATGKAAKGQITGWALRSNVKINGRQPYAIEFTYEADGRQAHGSSSTLDYDYVDSLYRGMEVEVEYAGGLERLAGSTYSVVGYAGLLGFLFPGIGLFMTFFAVRSNRREIAAFTHGPLAHGSIIESGYDYSAQMNGRHPYRIVWEFTVDANLYKGSLTSMSVGDLAHYVVGTQVGVLYLPEKPSVNTLYID